MPVCGSGAVVCSLSLLIRWAQRARCQAETPLIVLFRSLRPALYAKRLAATAVEQYNLYHEYSESDPELSAQIKRYWQALGLNFPGVKTPWSAVFISWCVKKAGASAQEFVFAAVHAKFVKAAIQNALKGVGVFLGGEIDQYAPQLGDIVHNNRSRNKFTYYFASTQRDYESHSAIV